MVLGARCSGKEGVQKFEQEHKMRQNIIAPFAFIAIFFLIGPSLPRENIVTPLTRGIKIAALVAVCGLLFGGVLCWYVAV